MSILGKAQKPDGQISGTVLVFLEKPGKVGEWGIREPRVHFYTQLTFINTFAKMID